MWCSYFLPSDPNWFWTCKSLGIVIVFILTYKPSFYNLETLGAKSQHFIFFLTYKFLNKLVLHYNRLEMIVKDIHTSLMDPLVSSANSEVLWKQLKDL
jgi:hypothetical protein